MKNKSFDCVEMKRKGAEAVYQKVATLSIEQQLEYWSKGNASLRQQMQPTIDKTQLKPGRVVMASLCPRSTM